MNMHTSCFLRWEDKIGQQRTRILTGDSTTGLSCQPCWQGDRAGRPVALPAGHNVS
jgi:hypothetical protein